MPELPQGSDSRKPTFYNCNCPRLILVLFCLVHPLPIHHPLRSLWPCAETLGLCLATHPWPAGVGGDGDGEIIYFPKIRCSSSEKEETVSDDDTVTGEDKDESSDDQKSDDSDNEEESKE